MKLLSSKRHKAQGSDGRVVTAAGDAVASSGGGIKKEFDDDDDDNDDESRQYRTLAAGETRLVNILRVFLLIILLTTMILGSVGAYKYVQQEERRKFQAYYEAHGNRIIDSFHDAVERRLGAMDTLATSITSYALADDTNAQFPFVTVPHFAIRGSDVRVQADSLILHWMPLVTDATRKAWEEYALANRSQIDETFLQDAKLRKWQDKEFGLSLDGSGRTILQQQQQQQSDRNESTGTLTVLDDGTGFHPRIWSFGSITPKADEPEGTGPYLPLWQRSPINAAKQQLLNLNFANTLVFQGALSALLEINEAVLNRAVIPIASGREQLAENLALGQYRHTADQYVLDPVTFLAYPVFDSFEEDRQLAGVLATNVYWKHFFSEILPPFTVGFVCVLENSFNQTLSYRIDGSKATYLGEGDKHDKSYDNLVLFSDVNEYVQEKASPETRSYTTVPLSKEFGRYTLRVYPSREAEAGFSAINPWFMVIMVVAVFLFTSVFFLLFVLVVERRQRIVMNKVIKTAKEVAATERDLNEFFAHECRNPLSSALIAHSFVAPATNDTEQIPNEDFRSSLQADVKIIGTCLSFLDDFLKTMLEMYQAAANKTEVEFHPTNLRYDVFEPVCSMLYQRNTGIDVSVECPENLVVLSDSLRLKQIMLNLGINSSKFVKSGFIRFRAAVVDGLVEMCVEDSGPGISGTGSALFDKYQTRLDVLSQGNGIGLNLCRHLARALNARISLDETYDSGVEGSPGARFVVRLLNSSPLPHEVTSVQIPVDKKCMESMQQKLGAESAGRDSREIGANVNTLEEGVNAVPEQLSVLFVDDDRMLRKLFSRSLKRTAPSWKVRDAESGEEALVLLDMEEYDLIFMDQYLASTEKRLLGTETIIQIRAKGIQCTICGLSANNLEQEFIDAGADYFILKPFPCNKTLLEQELIRITSRIRHPSVDSHDTDDTTSQSKQAKEKVT